MRRHLLIAVGLLALLSPAKAADSNVTALPTNASAFGGTELLYMIQGAADRKGTPAQMATYTYGLMTGDCTVTASAITCLKTNGSAFTSAATTAIGTSGATIPLLSTANTWTLGQTFSTAPTFGSITGSTQCLHVNTSGVLSGTGSDCGSGAGAVSSVTGGIGITVSPTTGAVVVSSSVTPRNNTATSDTLLSTDSGSVVTESNASPVAVGIAVASTSGFGTGNYWTVKNKGAGLVTITPTTSTIDGNASLTVKQNQSVDFYSDGTNYWTMPGRPTNVACADLTNAGALCSTTPGTGVATAAAAALSANGGLTTTIASGATAMGTSAIASAACATVVTATATNTATTDVLTASFNGDPHAVTGYIPATAGMLTIITYPTANTANFLVCNNTSASITPGAITLNWRVVR